MHICDIYEITCVIPGMIPGDILADDARQFALESHFTVENLVSNISTKVQWEERRENLESFSR